MDQPSKFEFDTIFNEAGDVVTAPPKKKKSVYRADEVDQIRETANAEGAHAAALASEQSLLAQLTTNIGTIAQTLEVEIDQVKQDATQLAFTIASKLAEHALTAVPTATIEHIVSECIKHLHDEPVIKVGVPPEQADTLTQQLTALARDNGYMGQLSIVADQNLGPGDCKLDWMNGGITREFSQLKSSIVATINEHWPNAILEPSVEPETAESIENTEHKNDIESDVA